MALLASKSNIQVAPEPVADSLCTGHSPRERAAPESKIDLACRQLCTILYIGKYWPLAEKAEMLELNAVVPSNEKTGPAAAGLFFGTRETHCK